MKVEIMIAVLGIICIGALVAVFVLWAKLDEQKKLTQEERNRRWDEISRAEGLEEELRRMYLLDETRRKQIMENDRKYFEYVSGLQNKLSALLCPHNDHVWKDGRCVKCGRVKDALP